jgi:hypothetical protein
VTAVIPARTNGNGVTAAAVRLPTDAMAPEVMRKQRKLRAKTWQEEAWLCAGAVGQIKQGYRQLADAASKVRLYIGYRPERDGPVEPADGLPGFNEATDLLTRLDENSSHGLPGIVRKLVLSYEIPGEAYLTGEGWREPSDDLGLGPMADPGEERWEVRSVSELSSKEEMNSEGVLMVYYVKDGQESQPRRLVDPYVSRLWQPDPQWSNEPDSPMRAVLEDCDELLILKRGVRAIGRSRIPAGFWFLPNNINLISPSPGQEQGDTGPEATAERIMQVLMAPLSDEGDPAALVPGMAFVDPDVLDKIKEPINFQRLLAKEMLEERDKLIRRILQSLNFPVETVAGMAEVNHWTGYLIDESLFRIHIEPDVQLACHGLTTGFMRPLLEEYDVDPSAAKQLMIWYDPADLIARPNNVEDTFKAAAMGAVGLAKVREVIGANDDDIPTPEDLEIVRSLRGGRAADGGQTPVDVPGDGTQPEPEPVTAAARSRRKPLGQRLLAIDRDLRSRLEAAATLAMGRALEKAGARVRSRAEGDNAAKSAIAASANRHVPSTLGPAIVVALGMDDGTLLEGAFDDLAEQYERWTGQAQAKSLNLAEDELDLDDAETVYVAGRQNEDRSASWAWFAAALVSLASSRLYDPNPSAPAPGEHDPSLSVPTGVIREAMARAGGAAGPLIGDRPAGGVATGLTLLDLFAQHGRVTEGWEWVWGGSSVPFEGHELLDGVAFETWDDPVLTVLPGDEWVGPLYRIGDHLGCSCDFVPLMAESEMAEAA